MQINSNINIHKNTSPYFGRVIKFKNNFETYNDIFKEDYLTFIDTFKKSEPIKEYCKNHDVNIEFYENYPGSGCDMNLYVLIKDSRLPNDLEVLGITGKISREKSPFQILTELIQKIKPDDIENNFRKAKTYLDEKQRHLAMDIHSQKDKERYYQDLDNKISLGIDEINNL